MSSKSIEITDLPYADGDFYAFEQMLSAKEQDRLAEIRDFLAREVGQSLWIGGTGANSPGT